MNRAYRIECVTEPNPLNVYGRMNNRNGRWLRRQMRHQRHPEVIIPAKTTQATLNIHRLIRLLDIKARPLTFLWLQQALASGEARETRPQSSGTRDFAWRPVRDPIRVSRSPFPICRWEFWSWTCCWNYATTWRRGEMELKVRWTNGIEWEWRNTTEGNKWLFKWESWDTWRVWLRFSRWEVSAFRTKWWLIRSIKL